MRASPSLSVTVSTVGDADVIHATKNGEPIVYNKRCERVDKVVWVEYLYVELVG